MDKEAGWMFKGNKPPKNLPNRLCVCETCGAKNYALTDKHLLQKTQAWCWQCKKVRRQTVQ